MADRVDRLEESRVTDETAYERAGAEEESRRAAAAERLAANPPPAPDDGDEAA